MLRCNLSTCFAAQAAGYFDAENHAIQSDRPRTANWQQAKSDSKARTVNRDEGARPDTSLEGLAKLEAVFAAKGSVTAGEQLYKHRTVLVL